jgi:hypothetical protein
VSALCLLQVRNCIQIGNSGRIMWNCQMHSLLITCQNSQWSFIKCKVPVYWYKIRTPSIENVLNRAL